MLSYSSVPWHLPSASCLTEMPMQRRQPLPPETPRALDILPQPSPPDFPVSAAAASAALGAISEDSSILGKSLIFVGLAEGVCLYGLIISFMIIGKL